MTNRRQPTPWAVARFNAGRYRVLAECATAAEARQHATEAPGSLVLFRNAPPPPPPPSDDDF